MTTPARNVSPWTPRQKLGRLAWSLAQGSVFKYSFHSAYRWRAWLLRSFGATIGRNVRVRRTVAIEIPWNLTLGDDVSIGDRSILYCLGPVRVGDRSFLSQGAHLCAGSHDYRSPDYPLLRPPVTIGTDCWIAAEAFVGPGVTVGDRSVVGARAAVFADVPPGMIVGGNPAKVIKPREFTGPDNI